MVLRAVEDYEDDDEDTSLNIHWLKDPYGQGTCVQIITYEYREFDGLCYIPQSQFISLVLKRYRLAFNFKQSQVVFFTLIARQMLAMTDININFNANQ